MKKRFSDLPVEKRLALIAFFLGFFALFGANPYEHAFTPVNTKEVAFAANSRSTKVDPYELADWLIKDKADFRLIDLRTEKEYNEYRIPKAENLSIMELQNSSLEKTEKIVLYSGSEMESAQAWFLLRSKGYKAVYILSGGMEAWKEEILFPKLAEGTNPEEQAKFEKISEVSKYFGGSPQSSGQESEVRQKTEMPKLQAPESPRQGGGVTSPRKKKEGC
ncbi:MAG: rhodanese-like domain-containing protein [Acidobacteriota bacterium]